MTDYVSEDDVRAQIATVHPLPGAGPRPRLFKRIKFADINPRPAQWLVKHFMPSSGVAFMYGPSTVGKSFVAINFALRIARGKDILGHRSRRAGVLYVAAEDSNGLQLRIKGLREKWGLELATFELIATAPNLVDQEHIDQLAEEAESASADMVEMGAPELGLIIIDTASAALPGVDENNSEKMSLAMVNLQALSLRTGCLILVIAHPGKNVSLGIRGWSGMFANADAVYLLDKDADDGEVRVGLVEKLKNGRDGERFGYRLKELYMGTDEEGDAITTAYPVFEEPPRAAPKKTRGPTRTPTEHRSGPSLILTALGRMIDEEQAVLVPHSSGVPVGQKGVTRADLKARAVNIGYGDATDNLDSVKAMFNRDIRELVAARKVRQEGVYVWLL